MRNPRSSTPSWDSARRLTTPAVLRLSALAALRLSALAVLHFGALAVLLWATNSQAVSKAEEAGPTRIAAALPGAVPFDAELQGVLERSLAAKGPDYVPRTRHLRAGGSPVYTNRLLLESSPYLQQHAHNPVDWRPWGEEAFAAARALGRPVLVSIGYSTCHWCHVMEEESFDDPVIAAQLNANFITIKVDREARPDVDSIYMTAVHAMTGSGGWPLNVFLTPERQPFYGGTYFPPKDRGGRPGFSTLLSQIQAQWVDGRGSIDEFAAKLAKTIRDTLEGVNASTSQPIDATPLLAVLRFYGQRADPEWGGVGQRTKFPSSLPVRLLLRIHRRSGDENALAMATLALEKMATGGIHDQLGGGFHRYSTEARWLIPHFEKMLYDNALLALAYLEGWQATGREDFAQVARRTLDYAAREMSAPGGGFYSATDADSLTPSGEMEEGYFFTWTPAEIRSAIGKEPARVLGVAYGVTEQGNFDGRNILQTWTSSSDAAKQLGLPPAAFATHFEAARQALYQARARRPAPLRDDKILAAWNGLMISAFARAALAFDDEGYRERAARAADFVLSNMRVDGRLQRVFRDDRSDRGGRSDGLAFLEDYAFAIAGLLDVYEATAETRWLREAIALQKTLDLHYADEVGGGYFKSADDGERLLAREKPARDGALPSGNAVAALNLLRLADLTLDDAHLERAALLFSAFAEVMERDPASVSELLMAVDYQLDRGFEIVIARGASNDDAEALLAPVRRNFVPNRVLSIVSPSTADEHAVLVPLVKGKRAQAGRATAYVCRDRVCDYPTSDPLELARQLSAATPLTLEGRPVPGL